MLRRGPRRIRLFRWARRLRYGSGFGLGGGGRFVIGGRAGGGGFGLHWNRRGLGNLVRDCADHSDRVRVQGFHDADQLTDWRGDRSDNLSEKNFSRRKFGKRGNLFRGHRFAAEEATFYGEFFVGFRVIDKRLGTAGLVFENEGNGGWAVVEVIRKVGNVVPRGSAKSVFLRT